MISKGHIDQAENFFTSWIVYWENNFIDDVQTLYKKKRNDFDKEIIISISALNIHKAAKRYYNELKETSLKDEDVPSWDIKKLLIKEFNRQTTYFSNLKTKTNELVTCVRVRDSEIDFKYGKTSILRTIKGKTIQIPTSDNSSTSISLNSLKEIISNDGLVISNTEKYLPYVLGRCYFLRFLHAELTKILNSQDYDEDTLNLEVTNFLKTKKGAITGRYIYATSELPNINTYRKYEYLTGHTIESMKGGYYRASKNQKNENFTNEDRAKFWSVLASVLTKNQLKELVVR